MNLEKFKSENQSLLSKLDDQTTAAAQLTEKQQVMLSQIQEFSQNQHRLNSIIQELTVCLS